jgi:recombination protein RecT
MATQLATQKTKDPIEQLVTLVESPTLKAQIVRALPKQLSIERFMRLAITVLRERDDLAACNPLSIIGSIMEAAQLGLELDPVLGHGYLVPFWSKDERNKRCIFIPGYRGFVHLMRNSGLVHNVNAEVVLRGEKIEVELGTQRLFKHTPVLELDRAEPDLWLGAYATVTFFQGEPDFEFMNCSAILAIKERSPAKDKNGKNVGPWKTDELEMWKKTPIRRIAKRMPLSPATMPLLHAASRDELRELVPGYTEAQSMAPALEDMPPVQDSITVATSTDQPPTATAAAPSAPADTATAAAAPATEPVSATTAKAEPEKDEKPSPVKGGANRAGKKSTPPPPAKVAEYLSAGQQKSIYNYVVKERGFSEADLINMLGIHGYERLDQVPKEKFQTIWSECVNMGTKKKQG